MKYKMIAPAVPNIPWQDRPEGIKGAPIWRYSENPVVDRNPIDGVARIFNSAVMPYEGKFIGVFRGEQTNGVPYVPFIGLSTVRRYRSLMKKASLLCPCMHMIPGL